MDMEKRKREDDGESNGCERKPRRGDGDGGAGNRAAPADEEVEEFFAILKRIQVAVKYFEDRDARRCADTAAAAQRWRPTFEREDFDGVKTEARRSSDSEGNQSVGLDLNSVPGCDVSD